MPLEFTGTHWTADGDLDGLNSAPDYFLRLRPGGGQVGSGYYSPVLQDRFAIAAFTVEHSGQYGIADSFVSVADQSNDGVEVFVHVENGDRATNAPLIVSGGQTLGFDARLGYLAKGDTIYVGFGANQNHKFDSFNTDFSIVRVLPRAAPDLSLLDHDGEIISVNESRFGDSAAIPDDDLDDWQGIENAIVAAGINNASEIHFNPGTYNLSSNGLTEFQPLFELAQMNDLVFNGNGSTLIIDDPSRPLIHTLGSSNIIFKDLTIDYAEKVPARGRETSDLYKPLTYTQGIISDLDRNENTFTLTVNTEAFVAPDESFNHDNAYGWGYALDRFVDGRLKKGGDWHYRTESVTPGETSTRFKINVHHTQGLSNGDRYVMQRRHNVAMFGIYNGSSNVSLINVTAYSAPSVFISSLYSDTVNVIDSHAAIRPDDWSQTPNTQRWKSINADGVHIQSNRIGPWVENSTFNGTGDDVMNFYTRPMTVHEIVSDTELTLATLVPGWIANLPVDSIQIGDRLTFFNPVAGSVIKESKVIGIRESMVSDPSDASRILRMQTVTFDQPIKGIVPGDPSDRDGYLNDTTVFNHNAMRSALVQDSTLSNARRYGNYLMASNVQLIDNVYEGLSDEAITANNEPGWPLGPFAEDILIQGNQFIDNGFSRRFLDDPFHTGTVTVKSARYVNRLNASNPTKQSDHLVDTNEYVFRNVKILDNLFYHWNKSAVSVRNAQHVEISDNFVSGGPSDELSEPADAPLDFHYSANVTVESNTYVGGGQPVSASHTFGLSQSNNQTVQDAGLRTWLKFDRGSILADSSGNGSTTSFKGAGISEAGKFATAPIFNSTNSITVDQGDSYEIRNRTVSLWFEVNDADGDMQKQVLFEHGDANNGLNIYVQGGQVHIGAWSAGEFSTFLATSVTSGSWHHVALVIDSDYGKIRGYVNGTKFDSGSVGWVRPKQSEFSLGRVGGYGTRFHSGVVIGHSNGLQGKIDDVRIYDRVLGDAEVAALAGKSLAK